MAIFKSTLLSWKKSFQETYHLLDIYFISTLVLFISVEFFFLKTFHY